MPPTRLRTKVTATGRIMGRPPKGHVQAVCLSVKRRPKLRGTLAMTFAAMFSDAGQSGVSPRVVDQVRMLFAGCRLPIKLSHLAAARVGLEELRRSISASTDSICHLRTSRTDARFLDACGYALHRSAVGGAPTEPRGRPATSGKAVNLEIIRVMRSHRPGGWTKYIAEKEAIGMTSDTATAAIKRYRKEFKLRKKDIAAETNDIAGNS